MHAATVVSSTSVVPTPTTAFGAPPWPTTTTKLQRKGVRVPPQKKKVGYAIVSQIDLKPPPYSMVVISLYRFLPPLLLLTLLQNALEPHMSRETVETHWDRHHRSHVETLNLQIAGTRFDDLPLEDIVDLSYNNGDPLPPFNHAAQVWNHQFFWESMSPGGGGRPSGVLLELIKRDFGSFKRMLKELEGAAASQFGSGWAWLVYKANRLNVGNAVNPLPSEYDNKLVVTTTPNAVNPLVWDYSPLLAIDVWEHAYYLDYENRRAEYVSIFMEKLVSWEVVSSRLEIAMERAAERVREEERREEDEEAEMGNSEAVEMYLDSENDGSESE